MECLLVTKIRNNMQKVASLLEEVNTLKRKTTLKNDSTRRLLKNVENLKLENNKNMVTADQLKQENSELHNAQNNLEKNLASLRNILNERDISNRELQKKNVSLILLNKELLLILIRKTMKYFV